MKIITLTKGDITVKIAPMLGSNMFSFMYGKHQLIYSDPNILKQAGFTGTYVLFPTPNRVKDFTYTWNGKKHVLKKYGKTVDTHHQLVFDQPWHYTKPIVTDEYASFTTSIVIDAESHLFDGFPFPCTLSLEYRVYENRVRIHYTVKNEGNEPLPFGFGLHPHFARLSGNDKTYITIPARSYMENYPETIVPNGTVLDVSGTPCDVRKPTPVGNLSLDHVFTDLTAQQHATVDYRTLGFKVILETSNDFTHIVVWSGHPDAICIENQTCSTDAHNLWDRGFHKESHLIVIPTGQSHTGHIDYIIKDSSGSL